MARVISSLCFMLIVMVCHPPLRAELPLARLFTVFPPGGCIGTQVELNLTGTDLDEANQLHFSHAGITAKQSTTGTNTAPEPNKFLVTIATNVPPGVYEIRVVGRFGISNSRSFVVSDLPEANAPGTNNSPATASTVSLNSVINGHSEANAVAFYRFIARKGQRILIGCQAGEIDSRMEAALILYDSAAKELQRNHNGGLLDFSAPADGEYQLKIYDFLFRGGGEYFYRLSLRTGPHIDFIFPPSGLAGTRGKYQLYGRNLPGGTPASDFVVDGKVLERLEVEIELPREPGTQFSSLQNLADTTVDAFEYRLNTPQGVSNPVLISLATAPVVPEQQPNDKPEQAQSISPPCEVVGQFFPPGDRDWVALDARKGDVFSVEVFSHRLGLPTDPFLLVQRVARNEKGEENISDVKELYDTDSDLGGAQYRTSTRDPSSRFEVGENGVYRIQVRDLFNRSQADPRLVYRLTIRKPAPDFRLVAVPQPPPPQNKDSKEAVLWTPLLRRGETMPMKVMAYRRDNFGGEIDLKVENLPPGVACNEVKIEKDKTSVLLLLTAAENAAGWVGPLKIVGRAKIGESEVVREARGANMNWAVSDYNNEAVQARLTRDFVLAVSGVESAPISIESAETNLWETSETAKVKIPLKLTRRADFNSNLKLKAMGIGALDKLKELEVDGKSSNATVDLDLAELKIPPGTRSFYLQTQTSGKYRNNPEAAKAAEEALKRAEQLVTDLGSALKKANEVTQAAVKTAADSSARAKAASEAAATAVTAAAEAETSAKAAAEKLTAAKTALEAQSDSQELLSARDTAAKTAVEAESKSKSALEAKLIAEKAAAETQARAKADADAQIAAEKAEAEAPAKLKNAEKDKELAASRAKETARIAEPRDVTVTVYSAPIYVKVTPAPSSAAK